MSLTVTQGAVALDAAGLTFGSDILLVRFEKGSRRLAIADDRDRCLALLAVAKRGPLAPGTIRHLEAASAYWERGEAAIANFRLIFAGLPRLVDARDVACLRAAEYLLDHGMTPLELLEELDIDAPSLELEKYDPNEPRVPAGQGAKSGEWTSGFWDRVSHWLGEPVPVYDTDTGDEVGTQSRGRAIATNPLTIIGAGAAVLAGAELLPIAVEAGETALFTYRYLRGIGGRLGSTTTRQQIYEIWQEYKSSGEFSDFLGDGAGEEEYISGGLRGTKGGTFVDFTAMRADGTAVRIQTVDTLVDGTTPTASEIAAANRIRAAKPGDTLILMPKAK